MAITVHSLVLPNGESIAIRQMPAGSYVCPVCGFPDLRVPPYDPTSARPCFEWCACCETQFGWDDAISPDAPVGAQAQRWAELRDVWILKMGTSGETADQLRNLA